MTLADLKLNEVYTPTTASRVTGISRQTWHLWAKQGRLVTISTATKTVFTGLRAYEAAIKAKGLL